MKKTIEHQKEITEKYDIACYPDRKCCGQCADGFCRGTYHILPTGSEVFKHCCCEY